MAKLQTFIFILYSHNFLLTYRFTQRFNSQALNELSADSKPSKPQRLSATFELKMNNYTKTPITFRQIPTFHFNGIYVTQGKMEASQDWIWMFNQHGIKALLAKTSQLQLWMTVGCLFDFFSFNDRMSSALFFYHFSFSSNFLVLQVSIICIRISNSITWVTMSLINWKKCHFLALPDRKFCRLFFFEQFP